MDHTCHKCGAEVEAGQPFCPHCNAPLIRVNVPEPAPAFPPGTPAEMQPPAQQMPLGNQAGIDWKFGLRGALFAGVLLAVASLNPLLFVGLMLLAAGAFAVFYYQHKTSQPLSTSDGAKIGAVAGLFAGLLLCISIALQFFVGGLSSTMRSYMQQSAAQNNDPNVQAMVQKLNTPEGMAALVMAILMIALFGSIAVCCAGGAIGAAKFGKRKDR